MSAFFPFLIPFVLVFNVCYLIYNVFKRNVLHVIILSVLLFINLPFINRTYGFKTSNDSDSIPNTFQVLSYNVRVFNVYPQWIQSDSASTKGIIGVLKNSDADILCLQEFYNDPKSKLFNVRKQLKKIYKYEYFNVTFQNVDKKDFGMAIYSKYPIIHSNVIVFRMGSNNQVISTDIKMGDDTIRVYNIHLQSMHINDDELVDERTQATFVNKLTKALVQYKTGAVKRSKQIEQLIKDIKKSPYKVIIAGDLNDPPYSYTYEKLSKHLKNAFEEKGTGFGFTYNGKLPMLRIDQQFCDKGIKVCSFKTKNKIKFTDHVPIIGTYSLE